MVKMIFMMTIKQLRDSRLEGLPDLNTSSEYVRNKICEYMNHCIDIGVAGFRIDGAKHMLPEDLKAIYEKLKDVRVEYIFICLLKKYFFLLIVF